MYDFEHVTRRRREILTLVTELRPSIILCCANCANRCWHLAVVLLAVVEIDTLTIEQFGDANTCATCGAALRTGAGAVMASMASGFVAFGIHEVPHVGAWTMLLEAMRLDRIGKRAAHVVENNYLWSHDEMWTVQASCEVVR